MHYTPENITELEANQIFVFGSNGNGSHVGGAAKLAVEKFGAVMGQARGLQGQSYAIETLNNNMDKVELKEIKSQFSELFKFAKKNKDKTFIVTKIGCGIAGYTEEEIMSCFDATKVPTNVKMPLGWLPLRGYKGFNKGLVCEKRGNKVQYVVGEIATFDGEIEPCESGLHYCLNPLDVLNYYDITESEFAEVEGVGQIKDHTGDSKLVTNKLKINAKVDLPMLVKASIDFLFERCSTPAASGNSSQVATSGDYSQVAASGDSSQVATSGYYSQVAASGDSSQVAASGDSSQVATSGDYSKVEVNGKESVGANIGINGKIKGTLGSWITLAEYNSNCKPVCVKSAQIDGKKLKEDTWYELKGGEFIIAN